jgi:hypothetical protein
MFSFPDGLPLPLRDGYGFSRESPIISTKMKSGRSRSRRAFLSVPVYPNVSWLFTEEQAALFEGWVKWTIGYSQWFMCPLRTPLGLAPARVKFMETLFDGPELVGVNHYRYTATLEAFEMPVISEAELMDLLVGMDLPVMNAQLQELLGRWYTKSWNGAA